MSDIIAFSLTIVLFLGCGFVLGEQHQKRKTDAAYAEAAKAQDLAQQAIDGWNECLALQQ